MSAGEDPDIMLEQVLADMRADLRKLRRTLGEVRMTIELEILSAWRCSTSHTVC